MRAPKLVSLLVVALLTLGACFSPWQGGNASIVINLRGAEGRAAWPPTDDMFESMAHTIELSGPTGASTYELEKGTLTFSVEAAPGRWTAKVTALFDDEPYAEGSGEADVTAGQVTEMVIAMQRVGPSYTVRFESAGGSAVPAAEVAAGELLQRPGDPSKAIAAAGLYPGAPTGETFAGWYKDAALESAWDFDADKVTEDTTLYAKWEAPSPIDVSAYNGTTIIGKAIEYANENPDTYTLFIGAGTYDTDALILNTGFKLTIEGLGGESIVDRRGQGSVFTVEGSGTELTLGNNITLKGNAGNNAPLVTVKNGAKLILNTGSKITGNTFNVASTETGGAGILVDNAELLIAGGEVSGNIAQGTDAPVIRGGGVFAVNGSRVVMTAGAIKDNTIENDSASNDASGSGGGIAVMYDGDFEMSGGVIEGNKIETRKTSMSASGAAHASGGGVYLFNSSMRLTDGKIRNNSCHVYAGNSSGYSYGAGITAVGNEADAGSRLEISGGVISGNTASHYISTNNSYGTAINGAYGGAVLIHGAFYSFSKTGGIIYGNEATGTGDNGKPLANTAQSDSNGLGGGHAVFFDNRKAITEKLYRNTSSFDDDDMDSGVEGAAGGWETEGVVPAYTVTFVTNGGSVVPAAEVAAGELLPRPGESYKEYEIEDTMRNGLYHGTPVAAVFTGWFKDADLTSAWNFDVDKVTDDLTLYARWEAPAPIDVPGSTDGNNDVDKAITYANEHPAAYTLFINAGTYTPLGRTVTTGYRFVLEGLDGVCTINWGMSGSVFTIEGSGTELTLGNNITVQGNITNNAPLVTVTNSAKLVLNTGSKITGNTFNVTATETGGAGILIDNAELLIAGGEVSGNIAKGTVENIYGGGIYARNSSRVVMSDGAVQNNRIEQTYPNDGGARGGGIMIFGGANAASGNYSEFVMSGGFIEGNTVNAKSDSMASGALGGGICISGKAFFDFSGGTIRDNHCQAVSGTAFNPAWGSSQGGGICSENASVNMSGGIVSGNTTKHNLNSYISGPYLFGAWAGGVNVSETPSLGLNAYFKKTGGVIYGNEAAGNDEDGIALANKAQKDTGEAEPNIGHAVVYNIVDSNTKQTRDVSSLDSDTDDMNSGVSGAAGGWDQ